MRYKSANDHYKERFGRKMYKASVSLNVTCPNRDGSKGTGGCIFCSEGGSGEFSPDASVPVSEQIDMAVSKVFSKAGPDAGYIAYFQSFTNTYCDTGYLRKAIEEAIAHPKILAVSIGTRPDCLPENMVTMLGEMAKDIPVYIEMGLQTSSDRTALLINRCYETQEFADAVSRLKNAGINVIAHVIFGLPGETVEDMMDTVRYVVDSRCDGIKFTCLYVLRNTVLEKMYLNKEFETLTMKEYFDIVEQALEIIPDDMTVHRLTGDGPKRLLIAPEWTKNKRSAVNYINRRFGNG